MCRKSVFLFDVICLVLLTSQIEQVPASVADKDMTFTSKEVAAIAQTQMFQLRERVLPRLNVEYMKTDLYLIRWLRAKALNMDQAENMLIQHLRWRHQNQIDTIQSENWADMEADFPYTMDTHDLEGKPVGTIEIYEWDLRLAMVQGKNQRLMRYLYRLLEDVTKRIFYARAEGQNVTRFVVLGNADGFNIIQHACPMCLPAWVQFVRTFESQYPGFLDELIVVDATSTVDVVLDLVRPILSPATQNALRIFGHNRDKWLAYLDTKISRDQRRVHYGGTLPE